MGGLVYDTGALIAAASGRPSVWRLHRGALERSEVPLVVAPVLALARGGTIETATLDAFLSGCALADFPVSAARDAGRLLALSGSDDLATAAVVLAAITTRSAVVTATPDLVRTLARSLNVELSIAAV